MLSGLLRSSQRRNMVHRVIIKKRSKKRHTIILLSFLFVDELRLFSVNLIQFIGLIHLPSLLHQSTILTIANAI